MPSKRKMKTDQNWALYTNEYIRQSIYKFIRHNQPIPVALSQEAEKRFDGWDSTAQHFGKSKTLADYSDSQIRNFIKEKINNCLDIPDDLNAEAAKRFPEWNPELRRFQRAHRPRAARKSLHEYSDTHIRNLVLAKVANNEPIPDDLQKETIRRFKHYNPETHTFNRPIGTTTKIGRPAKPASTTKRWPRPRPTVSAAPKKPAPIKATVEEFDPYKLLEQQMSKQRTVAHPLKSYDVRPGDATVLNAQIVRVRNASGINYNNVTINGKTILTGHLDTQLQSFMDGKYLGVYGIWTGDPQWSQTHQWILYDTELNACPAMCARYDGDGKRTYITSIFERPHSLAVTTNSRCTIEARIKKLPMRTFQLADEKTR